MYFAVFCGIIGMKCVKGVGTWLINGGTIWCKKRHIWGPIVSSQHLYLISCLAFHKILELLQFVEILDFFFKKIKTSISREIIYNCTIIQKSSQWWNMYKTKYVTIYQLQDLFSFCRTIREFLLIMLIVQIILT